MLAYNVVALISLVEIPGDDWFFYAPDYRISQVEVCMISQGEFYYGMRICSRCLSVIADWMPARQILSIGHIS